MKTLLTIELVPKTAWYRNVRSHVSKDEWDALRSVVFERAGRSCEVCGGKGDRWPVECHEVWHYDDAQYVQTLVRMIALCPQCHEVKHLGLASVRGKHEQALRHLAHVNGWSVSDARLYLEASLEQWSRRSQHQWTLDISYLDQFKLHQR
jgi:hypothetical protein